MLHFNFIVTFLFPNQSPGAPPRTEGSYSDKMNGIFHSFYLNDSAESGIGGAPANLYGFSSFHHI